MNKLYDTARGLNALVHDWALRAAVDIIGEQLTGTEFYREDAVQCVQMAGKIEKWYEAREQSEASTVVGGRRSLIASPTASFLHQEYLLAIEPAVRQVRSHYFGKETAPFADDQNGADEWLGSRQRDERPLTFEEEDTAAGPHRQFFGLEKVSPLHELAKLKRAVSRATGFQEPDVVRYVLCGEEPAVVGVRMESRGGVHRVGDAFLPRSEVILTVLSPDLSQADVQKILAFIREVWTSRDGDPPLRFEDEDLILRRLLVELGDDDGGRRRRRGFWPAVLARWKQETGNAKATVAQLKMREQRLQRKLGQLKGETTP